MRKSFKRAFVCGWPIKHSKSPVIHSKWLDENQIKGSYEKIAIEPSKLADFVKGLKTEGFVGGNFTIPHKEAMLQIVDRIEPSAKKIGAINTVWFEEETLIGGNTDWLGFAANLDQYQPNWDNSYEQHSIAVVLGAGGASRGILYALLDRGFETIYLANRTMAKAELLAKEFGPHVHSIEINDLSRVAHQTHLFVNTTSLGMSGEGDLPKEVLMFLSQLPVSAIVNDIVYTPLETELLVNAKKLGLKTVDGLGMLLHQAAPGFEKWFGKKPQVTKSLRQLVLDDIRGSN